MLPQPKTALHLGRRRLRPSGHVIAKLDASLLIGTEGAVLVVLIGVFFISRCPTKKPV